MAFDGILTCTPGLKAGGDLTGAQYKFVKLNNAGDVVAIAAATDVPCGILQNKPNTGEAAQVAVEGVSKVQADEALDEGEEVGTSADGQAQTPAGASGVAIVGKVLKAAGAAGRIATIQFSCLAASRVA